jgi:hypothetical protein
MMLERGAASVGAPGVVGVTTTGVFGKYSEGLAGATITGGTGTGVVINPCGAAMRGITIGLGSTQSGPFTCVQAGLESGRLWLLSAAIAGAMPAMTKTIVAQIRFMKISWQPDRNSDRNPMLRDDRRFVCAPANQHGLGECALAYRRGFYLRTELNFVWEGNGCIPNSGGIT